MCWRGPADTARGRVFYTGLGHDAHVWADPRFRQHLAGGIRWVLTGRQ
ncbi:MAG: ThuA domain-containing protein [Candidatus Rokuibacteriota bacterium]